RVVSKLKALKKPLRKRVYNTGHIHERVIKLRHELDEVQKALDANPEDLILREEEATYLQAFNEAKLDEERFLKQKAKIDNVIQNEQNAEFEGSQVAEAFVSHYENFLGSSTPYDNLNMEGLFQNKVFDMFNSSMVRTVSDLEIKEAMFDIGDDCGPGPDGFTTAFFKKILGHCWFGAWYDTWDHQCPLINWLSPRDIASAGFHIKSLVAELILNGDLFWPHVWLRKAPNLNQIRVPILAAHSQDATYWRDLNGKQFEFLVKCAWEVLCTRSTDVAWRIRSDPHQHVADFLEISNLFQYGENQEEAVMLRTFPFSLSREAKTWMNELDEGTITSWNEIREAFISRYFSLAKFKRLLNEIHSFHQLDNETLVDAWPHDPTQGILIVGGIFLYNTPNEAFKILDDKVVELERQINQGLRNRQPIIENLERQFKYLEKIQQTKSFPHTSNTKPRHEIVYKPPSIRNENDKGDVKSIEEHEIKPTPTMPKPNLINSNSPTVSPFHKDCTVHISYTNAKTFADDVLPNHAGDKELKSTDGVGTGRMTKKKIKKDEIGMPKGSNKEWKLNEKVVPHNEEVYHYQWHPTEVIHLNRIIKET
ncbi:reverse transcriptase domain-containing protein, partial [Tanacetum coccineum]